MQGEARAAQQEVTGSKKESEALRGELDRTKGMVGTLRTEITDLLSQANATEEKLTQEVSSPVRAAPPEDGTVPPFMSSRLLVTLALGLHMELPQEQQELGFLFSSSAELLTIHGPKHCVRACSDYFADAVSVRGARTPHCELLSMSILKQRLDIPVGGMRWAFCNLIFSGQALRPISSFGRQRNISK